MFHSFVVGSFLGQFDEIVRLEGTVLFNVLNVVQFSHFQYFQGQHLTIVPEFLDRFAVGSIVLLLIDHGMILNVLSLVGVFERVQSLV